MEIQKPAKTSNDVCFSIGVSLFDLNGILTVVTSFSETKMDQSEK